MRKKDKPEHVEETTQRDFAAEKQQIQEEYEKKIAEINGFNITEDKKYKMREDAEKRRDNKINKIEKEEEKLAKIAEQQEKNANEEEHNKVVNARKQQYEGYIVSKEGYPLPRIDNVIKFFKNTDKYAKKIRHNEFTQADEIDGVPVNDTTIAQIQVEMERALDGLNNRQHVESAVVYVGSLNSYNPIKEAIEPLKWDGVERVETFFINSIGVEDTPLNRSLTKKWFYAMMKRLYEPGCRFDNMLLIYDKTQGTGKSTVIDTLLKSVGLGYTYSTTTMNLDNTAEVVQVLNRSWVVGVEELDSFIKASSEKAKAILSQATDQVRLAYKHHAQTYKRHCVFYGNTNNELFLKDYSSDFERRYWIMNAHGTPRSGDAAWEEVLPKSYCQLVLAEALYFYKHNPEFDYKTLSTEEVQELKKVQKTHKTSNNDDVLQERLRYVLNRVYPFSTFDNMDVFVSYAMNTDQYTYTADNGTLIKCCEDVNEYFDNRKKEGNLLISTELKELKEQHMTHIITRLPMSFLKAYIGKMTRRDSLTTQYIMGLLGDEWEYKRCMYNKKTHHCITRKFNVCE